MVKALYRLARDCRGATAIEYGLICALIVVAIIVSVGAVGGQTHDMWSNMANKVASAEP